ncbi:MAG: pyrroline-5-carboxylate reductase [Verrucomicrobia bacterium]|nr:pyrroline-5-carboxylate reductase [Verrucomicrobiota bacterium]
MSCELSIGFVGAGKMATALAQGWVKAGLCAPAHVVASDAAPAAREAFAREVGARTVESNLDVIREATVLVLAVKPDQVLSVLRDLRGALGNHHLVISIAAGVPLARLQEAAGDGVRLVRVMPNTPALVGECAAAYALGAAATDADGALAQRLFAAIGVAYPVKEALLDAVTGLSGSGPAYAFLMIEALSDGGVAAGLPREAALRLAAQTLVGAGRMVLETGLHPGALKDMVASPGGTTIEGLHELERAGVRGALMNAVRASADKARKLGQA